MSFVHPLRNQKDATLFQSSESEGSELKCSCSDRAKVSFCQSKSAKSRSSRDLENITVYEAKNYVWLAKWFPTGLPFVILRNA